MQTTAVSSETSSRPAFLDGASSAYGRRRNVLLLSGDVNGPFWDRKKDHYVSMETLLLSELSGAFTIVRVDIGEGVTFYDTET